MEYYNIESTINRVRTKIAVYKSQQQTWSERILTVSRAGLKRLEKLDPGSGWVCLPPTPQAPYCVFVSK